ncbi:dtdp-4-dehydrorhamnose reductase : dTDP-4-dehydrorhamnose reductase OS=Crinalium epipsammum PCC 9333 GN=Cri9333_3539 PE=4 SV=1: RmlD_sub_bind [Gemmataceae bacterium]|nr:dtdp-4-dehydrorhamnose reductase : dTDP-4-dehydrorhamnose reductase OS=Crinalium epipsammum PCC 9333 GN=Cri9333_3539 PE=4 SV=1: RmlD_sub_bind [Gemmataceae bacterium]VTT99033.1 dtdp-4-dehydrorhamnose reductase : dTDP-4-dehydrorhamnose reductase OS=Crinalium epipsammum PCC 9333 GN=Cri9333_3539 PE=4 SV=1: RmlD_sub_bind [Gemmataceae bacterium]
MVPPLAADRPEVWAGIECTVNRVGDRYADQLARSGHDRRAGDVEQLAALGVRAVRYPVLWERHAARPDEWARTADRLGRLRELGVRPVLGLVHHGSGPPHTSLVDDGFAPGLAAFAAEVARRFPWAADYTPVNEPLTTARFAGMYGHWYPHGRDDRTFAACLVNQCRAVGLAMAAVRKVNPHARLVQTDDLGQTHAVPHLQYQAEFENHRRWVTWDLLCGRVGPGHPMWDYFRWLGVPAAEVAWFLDHPCPPDVVGVNYYVTSERFLDDRLGRYPAHSHGGNGRHRYADTEAVRVLPGGLTGLAPLLRQAWDRYRLPVAVTEAHLGCTREEQLRWLRDTWAAACRVRAAGADVRAVTAWAALGAFDWDSLVTLDRGHYEPGLFDVRTEPPRPTALAALVRDLAAGREPDHPAADGPGWWQRDDRFPGAAAAPARQLVARRPVLIVGGGSGLGRAVARACRGRGLAAVAVPRRQLDTADPAAVARLVAAANPWAVVNAGGYAGVDAAESDADRCRRENVAAARVLAEACASRGVRFVTFSTDLVFDGRRRQLYREADAVSPLNVYGSTKAEAEAAVLAAHPDALVVRTGATFGSTGGRDFVGYALRSLRKGLAVRAAHDLTVTPAYTPDLVQHVLDLLVDGDRGVCHLATPEPVTWAGLARAVAAAAGLDPGLVEPRPAESFAWPAPRPAYTPLTTSRGLVLPQLADCLERFLVETAPRPLA